MCGVGGICCCSLVVLCAWRVCVCLCRIARSSLAVRKLVADSRVDSSLSLHMFGKAWVPLVHGQGNAGNPRSPQRPPVVSQSHLASPACGWVRACLVRLLLPLPARVSVSQCVSLCQMLARKPNLTPAAKPLSGFPPAELKLSLPCLQLTAFPTAPPFRETYPPVWSAVTNHTVCLSLTI